MCNHKPEQQWIPYIKTSILYKFLSRDAKYFSFHLTQWETFHQKVLCILPPWLYSQTQTYLSSQVSQAKKIVLMKCNSETFEHRNMFSKYDWYLKCLSLWKSAIWKWIVVVFVLEIVPRLPQEQDNTISKNKTKLNWFFMVFV